MADILDSIDELDNDLDENVDADDLDLDDLDDLDDDTVSGELVELDDVDDLDDYEMNERQATEITESIRSAATATFILLAEAHKHKAWKALGYTRWEDYVRAEFDMSTSRSYQLLDLSKAVALIEEATPEGTEIKLTEAQARDIKRELPKITEQIREETKEMSPEEAAARAAELIEEQRAEIAQQKKDDEKVLKDKAKKQSEEDEDAYHEALEQQADALLEADSPDFMSDNADDGFIEVDVDGDNSSMSPEDSMNLYNFFNMLSNISSLPEPDEFINIIPDARADEINTQLLEATAWLNRLQTLWELREK